MKRSASTLLDRIRTLWQKLESLSAAPEPEFAELSETRTEIRWIGDPHIFDTRSKFVVRNGKILFRFEDIKTIDITTVRDDNDSKSWRVTIKTGTLSGQLVGVTNDDADASIVAARIAQLTGKKVRSL